MSLSSSFLVLIFHSVLLASLCRGDRQELRSQRCPSTASPSLRQSIPIQQFVTTSTIWLQLHRGGSTNSFQKSPQVPSLIQSETDENIYDRYAACLAAIEGLRRIRDQTLQAQQQQCNHDPLLCTKRNIREAKEWATAIYAENASKVVEAMGMPLEQFNTIGKIVCNDAALKRKVWILVL
jgi:hypothetical protein